MSNQAGLAAIRAVGLLHQEGYELLRVWVAARVQQQEFPCGKRNFLYCNIHLYRAGEFSQQVLDFEVDHIALSYQYSLNVNAVLGGKIYPDFEYEELGNDGWYDPLRMANYLKGYADLSARWRGSDTQYVTWFKRLVHLAESGRLPVMVINEQYKGPGDSGAVLVDPYHPSREEPLFDEATR